MVRLEVLLDQIARELRWAVHNGNLTKPEQDRLNLMIKEYLAEHWTEKENPRHEVMEAVCALQRNRW